MLLQNPATSSARLSIAHSPQSEERFSLTQATAHDREQIYRIRHDIYARELRQHEVNVAGRLVDPIDDHNIYLVAHWLGAIAGFVSITPPSAPTFSIDKYVSRIALPFTFDEGLYEVRLLTVLSEHRHQLSAGLEGLGWHVSPGIANFLLARLPADGPNAETLVRACQKHGLFIRDAALMGTQLGDRMVRIAVKDADTNDRMIGIIAAQLAVLQTALAAVSGTQ